MRSIPWALPILVAVTGTCLLLLMGGGREVEACSTSPQEVTEALERSVTKLVRPRHLVSPESVTVSRAGSVPPLAGIDRVRRIVDQLAGQLEPERFSAPNWNTRLDAAAFELGPGEVRTLAMLEYEARSPTVRVSVAELLRVLRREARAWYVQPSERVSRIARQALGTEERTVPFEVAARTLAAWGDSRDHTLLLTRAREAETLGTRRALLLALGHAPSFDVACRLAGEPRPEAMLALSVFAEESSWALSELDRWHVAGLLEEQVLDAGAPEDLRSRALDALLAWSSTDAMETLVELALDPGTPDLLADRAVARIARGDLAEALEKGLFEDNSRRLQFAEALVTRAASTTDAALRGAVLDVLCEAAREERTPQERRRAVHALAKLPDRIALHAVARSLGEDPDPAVRAAAVVALRGFSDEQARELLGEAAANDRSDAVRRLALHELDRSMARE